MPSKQGVVIGMSCNIGRMYALLKQSEKDFKFFQEQLQLSNQSVIEGDNMTKVQKATIGGIPYLDKKTVLEKGVKKVKIETEAELVDTEFEGKKSKKLECICSTQVLDPTRVTWQMNNTTMNFLIDKFGDDTKTWIGKEVEIAVKQAGSSSPGVYPKDCSLEKVY